MHVVGSRVKLGDGLVLSAAYTLTVSTVGRYRLDIQIQITLKHVMHLETCRAAILKWNSSLFKTGNCWIYFFVSCGILSLAGCRVSKDSEACLSCWPRLILSRRASLSSEVPDTMLTEAHSFYSRALKNGWSRQSGAYE